MGRQLAAPQLPELLGPRPLAPVHVGTEHLLLGLLCEGRGGGAEVLESFGISLKAVREQAGELIGAGQQAPSGLILPTASARKALQQSVREAQQLGQDYVGTEHILLALTREGDDGDPGSGRGQDARLRLR